jgi:hypothetical protein
MSKFAKSELLIAGGSFVTENSCRKNAAESQKSLSFRAIARNLTSQALGTIKISPDGRNDIVTGWTFCEIVKIIAEKMRQKVRMKKIRGRE